MNSDETMNMVRQFLTLASAFAAGLGWITKDQAASIVTDLGVIVPAAIGLGSVAWSIYAHWNMKKVPESATAVALPAGPQPVGASVTPGLVKVVGALLVGFLVGLALYAQPAGAQTTNQVQTVLAQIQSVLDQFINAGEQFVSADLNLAIADAKAQTPPNTAAVTCWQTIETLNFQPIPQGAGLAYFKQRYLDAAAQYVALNQNCSAIAPLFVKAYDAFIQQASGLSL
jgi:hypothetical protein